MRSLSNLLSHLQNFYPRPLRGGRPDRRCRRVPARPISIHALCEEGDVEVSDGKGSTSLFLSTPSARRATEQYAWSNPGQHISIHALCEEGDDQVVQLLAAAVGISIHALCEEGDLLAQVCKDRVVISIHALCEEGDSRMPS